MSRTYRRKELRANRDVYGVFERDRYSEWVEIHDPNAKKWSRDIKAFPGSKAWKREVAFFHRDGKRICYGVPSSWCHYLDKPKKRHNQAEVRRIMLDVEYEPDFIPFKKDAMWTYW